MLIIKSCVSKSRQKCQRRIVLMLFFTVNGAFDFALKYYPPRSNSEIAPHCFRPLELFDFFPTGASAPRQLALGKTRPWPCQIDAPDVLQEIDCLKGFKSRNVKAKYKENTGSNILQEHFKEMGIFCKWQIKISGFKRLAPRTYQSSVRRARFVKQMGCWESGVKAKVSAAGRFEPLWLWAGGSLEQGPAWKGATRGRAVNRFIWISPTGQPACPHLAPCVLWARDLLARSLWFFCIVEHTLP